MKPRADDELADHLQRLEERLLEAPTRAKPEVVASLLTEGFREFGSSGRVYTRQQILSELASETPVQRWLTEFRCERLTNDHALVTYRSHRLSLDGTEATALRSSLWVREASGWRMHFHQGTIEP